VYPLTGFGTHIVTAPAPAVWRNVLRDFISTLFEVQEVQEVLNVLEVRF
jgi:hypothetical protein